MSAQVSLVVLRGDGLVYVLVRLRLTTGGVPEETSRS